MRIIFLLLIVTITCCQNNPNPLVIKNHFSFYPKNSDLVLNDPAWKESRLKDYKVFSLPSLFNGTDSFEIRIWPWQAFDPHKRVIALKLDSLGWQGHNYYSYTKNVLGQDNQTFYPGDSKKLGQMFF